MRLGTVFDEREAAPLTQIYERCQIGRLSVQVDRDDGRRSRAGGGGCCCGIDCHPGQLDIHGHGPRSDHLDRCHGGDCSVRHRDYLVARPDSQRSQGELERIGAAVDADPARAPDEVGELVLESLDGRPQHRLRLAEAPPGSRPRFPSGGRDRRRVDRPCGSASLRPRRRRPSPGGVLQRGGPAVHVQPFKASDARLEFRSEGRAGRTSREAARPERDSSGPDCASGGDQRRVSPSDGRAPQFLLVAGHCSAPRPGGTDAAGPPSDPPAAAAVFPAFGVYRDLLHRRLVSAGRAASGWSRDARESVTRAAAAGEARQAAVEAVACAAGVGRADPRRRSCLLPGGLVRHRGPPGPDAGAVRPRHLSGRGAGRGARAGAGRASAARDRPPGPE